MLIYTAKECNTGSQDIHLPANLDFKTNNHSEPILLTDFKAEDTEAYYITTIKSLLRTSEENTFYNNSQKLFPLLKPLLHYSHHSDVMIKNTARISLMMIFQKSHGETTEYINSIAIPKHMYDILLNLKQIALDIQHFHDRHNITAMEKMHLYYTEELEYVDDILRFNPRTRKKIILIMVNDFIMAFIFPAIIYGKQPAEHASQITSRIGLYLLFNLLNIIRDFTVKECVSKLILQQGETVQEVQSCANTQQKSIIELINSMQLTILKYKTDIDTLYALHILYNVQTHVSENSTSTIIFYDKFLYTLIKSMFNYQLNSPMECIKLKLLFQLLKPLTKEITTDDSKWLKLQEFLSQAIEILYSDICKVIQNEIENLILFIDEEYYTFINMKLDISSILKNVNYLVTDDIKLSNLVNNTQIALHYFFYVRSLYLTVKSKKETILPMMKMEEKIGKLLNVDNCIKCQKLSHKNSYDDRHFLKLNDKQLLVLQRTENEQEGIVIFNSFYKDIIWSKCTNNVLRICEILKSNQYCLKNTTKSLYIDLKFYSYEDLQFVTDILRKAKLNQIKTVKKQLQKLVK